MICPNCHSERPNEAKFCLNCGTALIPQPQPKKSKKGLFIGLGIAGACIVIAVIALLVLPSFFGERTIDESGNLAADTLPNKTLGEAIDLLETNGFTYIDEENAVDTSYASGIHGSMSKTWYNAQTGAYVSLYIQGFKDVTDSATPANDRNEQVIGSYYYLPKISSIQDYFLAAKSMKVEGFQLFYNGLTEGTTYSFAIAKLSNSSEEWYVWATDDTSSGAYHCNAGNNEFFTTTGLALNGNFYDEMKELYVDGTFSNGKMRVELF